MTIKECKNPYIEQTQWMGKECIRFSAGGYTAMMIPEVGANVIELRDNINNVNLLRRPDDDLSFKIFKNRPQVYGLPLLFPPNRIEDGRFRVNNKFYQFPINEPKNNNYIHGFIKNDIWKITKKSIVNKNEVGIEAEFNFTSNHEFYKYLPHEFQARLNYNLSSKGLKQTTSIFNKSSEELPLGIGFHTAFNIPFHPESSDSNCRLIASIDKRWEQDNRNLPTGKIIDLNEQEREYFNKGIIISENPIESHYILKDMKLNGHKFRGAIIEDRSKGLRVIYEMGSDYKHIVVWNDMGDKHYVCIEPQTWAINAPNIKLDPSITGFKTLGPGKLWNEACRICADRIK